MGETELLLIIFRMNVNKLKNLKNNMFTQYLINKNIIITAISVLTSFLLFDGCTGITWEQAMEHLQEQESEVKELKQQVIIKERENDLRLSLDKDLSTKINKCSNDIAETKYCLNTDYDKLSDTSLIYFNIEEGGLQKDTAYFNCCDDYQKRYKLKKEDYDNMQRIWDEISADIGFLRNRLNALTAINDSLNKQISEKRLKLNNCETNLYKIVDANIEKINEFRINFIYIEKIINSKELTREERIKHLSELETSKISCLPEFRDRYKSMKKSEGM